mgnify:FL=1
MKFSKYHAEHARRFGRPSRLEFDEDGLYCPLQLRYVNAKRYEEQNCVGGYVEDSTRALDNLSPENEISRQDHYRRVSLKKYH